MRLRTALSWCVILVLVGAACSAEVSFSFGGQSAGAAAEGLIEGDLATQIGLGPLDATCQDLEDPAIGDTFTCTAFTQDGDVIRFNTVVEDEETIDVTSENLILAEAVPVLEQTAVDALEEATGRPLGIENFDCGDQTIIVDIGGTVACTLTDPGDGARYDSIVTINSREPLNIDVEVAPTPQGDA